MQVRHMQAQDIRSVIAARTSRRRFLLGSGASLASVAASGFVGSFYAGQAHAQTAQSSLTFTELKRIYDQTHHVADGCKAEVVAAWGDPMVAGQGAFDAKSLTAAEQASRFGYNCDYLAYMPLPRGSANSDNGLLRVNNEYVSFNVMFPPMPDDDEGAKRMAAEQVALCNAAIGHSIVEVKREGGKWAIVQDSRLHHRITLDTPMAISGPHAGHDAMKTSADPEGKRLLGTNYNYNCGGGVTPGAPC